MSKIHLPYYVVDAFSEHPFAGNPAAVVLLDKWLADQLLQNIATEMNLSETAFLVARNLYFDLRWFTPKIEVDLCGHATLAAAKVMAYRDVLADGESISFETRSGKLDVLRLGENYEMNFPMEAQEATVAPPELSEALGMQPVYVGRNRFDFLFEAGSAAIVRALAPDYKQLSTVACRGVIVTARSDFPGYDFVSRFFAPAAGIDEDPVTGSAHCCLADFWSKRLQKDRLIGYQASRRGGLVDMSIRGSRVLLGGQAVVVAHGTLMIG